MRPTHETIAAQVIHQPIREAQVGRRLTAALDASSIPLHGSSTRFSAARRVT